MNLKRQVLQGGAIMLLRQGVGVFLSLVGVLVITRLVGPTEYGYDDGWAEIAALASYFLVHRFATERVGKTDYSQALVWFGVGLAMIVGGSVAAQWRYLALLLPLLPLALPVKRESLDGCYQMLRRRSA